MAAGSEEELEMRARFVGAAVLAAALVTSSAEATEVVAPPVPLTLAWCLERASGANPSLAADAAQADAARERIGSAGALEDPRFSYEASNVPVGDWDFKSTPLSGHQLRLSQRLPFPGLLSNRAEAARSGARAAEAELDDRRHSVAADVERAWAELGFAQRAVEITDRNLDLLRQLVEIAEARYRVGSGLQPDVLRAHVELTALLQQRLRHVAAVDTAEARLAALLDLPEDARLGRTAQLEELGAIPERGRLLARVEEASPRLRALQERVEEARRRRRAAQLEGYPDVDVGLGYRVRRSVAGDTVDGDDFVSAGVTLRLPVNRSKWRSRVAEREALLRREEARLRGERAALRDRIRSGHARLVRAHDEVALLGTGLLPQARQSLESSRAGYEVGRVDFPSLLDAQINLVQAELRLVQAQAERREAFAGLEAALGEGLR
jgi:outer membrane protein TolC